jgi:tRNA pseudouridine65 synthase
VEAVSNSAVIASIIRKRRRSRDMGPLPAAWMARLAVNRGVKHIKDATSSGLHALEKPAGVLSHPNMPQKASLSGSLKNTSRVAVKQHETLFNSAYYDFGQQIFLPMRLPDDDPMRATEKVQPPGNLWLLHRLDSATSGVILVASDKSTAQSIVKAFKTRGGVKKTYVALAFDLRGIKNKTLKLDNVSQQWDDDIVIDKKGEVVRATEGTSSSTQQVKRATTLATLLSSHKIDDSLTVMKLALSPVTGLTHQLRYQCAKRGMPLIGDKNYGDVNLNKHFHSLMRAKLKGREATMPRLDMMRLFLHANKVDVNLQLSDGNSESFVAECVLPEEFDFAVHSWP